MTDRKMVDDLIDQAYAALHKANYGKAMTLGRELLQQRHARGFEIIALSQEQQGKTADAIATLKDGISKVPAAWALWELLGNIYSDQGNTDEAHKAYQKALACPNADTASINYNYAIQYKREKKFDRALALLDHAENEALKTKVKTLRISIFNGQGRHADVFSYGATLIAELLNQNNVREEEMQDLARVYAELARAQLDGNNDKQSAWEHAWKALEWDRCDGNALAVVREIVGKKSAASKWYKLTVDGQWYYSIQANKQPPAFTGVYEVVAETPEQALIYAQDLEPLEVRPSMRIRKTEDLGSFADNLQGVYWRGPYTFQI